MVQPFMVIEDVGKKRRGSHTGGIPQKYFLSDAQRRLLLERYDGRTETINELMRFFPGVPRSKVRAWAYDLGLTNQKEPCWTQEERDYLERNLHKKSVRAIAKHLGRTVTAVKIKAKRLGINKQGTEGYTLRGLCLGFGLDHHVIDRWIANGWLKGRRRQTERVPGRDIWLFTDRDIRLFVKHHPQEIDPRKADWLWLVDILVGGLGELSPVDVESEQF